MHLCFIFAVFCARMTFVALINRLSVIPGRFRDSALDQEMGRVRPFMFSTYTESAGLQCVDAVTA